ncbi:hypothetical protein BDA99DRAFT_523576 [Phascolomyces articulosus]|uniref:Uncharacterized protein n=1 Tax=Phascolomyces articulosus TaxID=60185 RepID=A0AAD5K0U2_9FUNG|nr:hypothetical protein BDA99DRAFT_523576 [Phascolomyces articulosus]
MFFFIWHTMNFDLAFNEFYSCRTRQQCQRETVREAQRQLDVERHNVRLLVDRVQALEISNLVVQNEMMARQSIIARLDVPHPVVHNPVVQSTRPPPSINVSNAICSLNRALGDQGFRFNEDYRGEHNRSVRQNIVAYVEGLQQYNIPRDRLMDKIYRHFDYECMKRRRSTARAATKLIGGRRNSTSSYCKKK